MLLVRRAQTVLYCTVLYCTVLYCTVQERSDGCWLSGEPRLLLYIAQFNYDFVLSKHIQFLDRSYNFDIHNETFKYKEFSLTLMFPTIQEMMRWIFPVYLNINDATHEMAAGKILQSLNKHSSITPGGKGCICSSGVLVCKAKYFHRHQK